MATRLRYQLTIIISRHYDGKIKVEGQLNFFSWNCTISRLNFEEKKIKNHRPQKDFPIGYMRNMLGNMTWSRDQTGYKHPVLSHLLHLLPLICLITRGETLSHSAFSQILEFSFLLSNELISPICKLASPQNYSETIPKCVLAEFTSIISKIF